MKAATSLTGFASWLDGFAGWPRDGFFGKPTWVDGSKPAGHTSQTQELGFFKTMLGYTKLEHFFFSPNLIWFLITLTMYLCFPYDLEAAAQGWSLSWMGRRMAVIYGAALLYYGFFFCSLYGLGMSQRKFEPEKFPTFGNMLHNMWYWHLGVLQWSLSECAMCRLWATGKVPYVPDSEVLKSPTQMALTVILILVMPIWRDIHFYFAHRFSHIRALYKYVHSLHHRNTDPEPFSGLCMHPVEHLIYFSNALVPTLVFPVSPLIYMWLFIHLGLAPAAGHSGFEDHWQADQYHYVHHAKFECNYGSPSSGWLDQYFGTFREKLGASGAYAGTYKDDYDAKGTKAKIWSGQSYLGLQKGDTLAFSLFCLSATLVMMSSAAAAAGASSFSLPGQLVGALVAFGPSAFGLALCAMYDKMHWRWPFHKESVVGAFGFFGVGGVVICLLPVFRFVTLLCTP